MNPKKCSIYLKKSEKSCEALQIINLNNKKSFEKIKIDETCIISCHQGYLYEYSPMDQKIIHSYGKIMEGTIFVTAITSDKNYLFVGDQCGNLKKIDLKQKTVAQDYGKVYTTINSIVLNKDDLYLFVGDTMYGRLKQWSTLETKIKHDYGILYDEYGIYSLLVTNDSKFLFAGSNFSFSQFDIKKYTRVQNYANIMTSIVESMAATSDSKYLFVSDTSG